MHMVMKFGNSSFYILFLYTIKIYLHVMVYDVMLSMIR